MNKKRKLMLGILITYTLISSLCMLVTIASSLSLQSKNSSLIWNNQRLRAENDDLATQLEEPAIYTYESRGSSIKHGMTRLECIDRTNTAVASAGFGSKVSDDDQIFQVKEDDIDQLFWAICNDTTSMAFLLVFAGENVPSSKLEATVEDSWGSFTDAYSNP